MERDQSRASNPKSVRETVAFALKGPSPADEQAERGPLAAATAVAAAAVAAAASEGSRMSTAVELDGARAFVEHYGVQGEWKSDKGECRIFGDCMDNKLSYEEDLGEGGCLLRGKLEQVEGNVDGWRWQAQIYVVDRADGGD